MMHFVVALLSGSLLTALVGLASLPWALRKIRSEVQKNDADAAQTVTATALTLVEPLRAEVQGLRARVASADAEVTELTSKLQQLTAEFDQYRLLHPAV